ncbi:MAG: CarD family transcriptional regulator [Clostridia bacterium]|nr:CarD family transcriptional regulator [Clostridia bacterium]
MLSIGSYVSYRAEGVCKISDIRTENFGVLGRDVLYYVLNPVGDEKSVFFVPVDNERLVSMMRKILSADEITDMIKASLLRGGEWISDSKQRSNRFKEILSVGEREELVLMIHILKRHIDDAAENGKKSYITDVNAMKRASKILFDEFSMTIPMSSPDDVIALIEKIYEENK